MRTFNLRHLLLSIAFCALLLCLLRWSLFHRMFLLAVVLCSLPFILSGFLIRRRSTFQGLDGGAVGGAIFCLAVYCWIQHAQQGLFNLPPNSAFTIESVCSGILATAIGGCIGAGVCVMICMCIHFCVYLESQVKKGLAVALKKKSRN
jgi:hypothetical protein